MTEWQLRDYRIQEGHLDDFVEAWISGVLPLRRDAGFGIHAWTVTGESRFLWILTYDRPGTFAEADEVYYRSAGRAAVDPDPTQWIVETRTAGLTPVDDGAPG